MSSYRCSSCGALWPLGKDFQPCPECLEKVWYCSDPAMPKAEAHTRMTRSRFQRWLVENDRLDPVEKLEQIPVEEKAA